VKALDGRLAVVTGGTRGIGRGIVDRFVTEGAHVVVTARTAASGEEIAKAYPLAVTYVAADAARPAELEAVVQAVKALGRPVDVVVANAGGGGSTLVASSTEAEFDAVIAANVKSAFFTVQALLPYMRDGGSIVLIGSIAGSNGGVGAVVYNAAKAAVRSLARSFTAELAPRGIRANVVSPGPTQTAGFDAFIGDDKARLDGVIAAMPVGRVSQPSDVAAAVLFMASDQSRQIAGAELVIDGGMSQI
jgi:NAD(P)-dependent dehydrogenase (short-subunit alcohol dehydrogenase family)